MAREEYGWALQETKGGRKGNLITTYTPYQFLIQTAIFKSRIHAQNFIDNSDIGHTLTPVRVKVTIERIKEDDDTREEG